MAVSDTLGAVQATARYDSWGNLLPGGGGIPQFGFTGREPDATGLTYFRARYYDPTLGRFTQRDPIGLAGGLNPYSYVSNSPQNFTDPLGLIKAAVSAFDNQATNFAGNSSSNSAGFWQGAADYFANNMFGGFNDSGTSNLISDTVSSIPSQLSEIASANMFGGITDSRYDAVAAIGVSAVIGKIGSKVFDGFWGNTIKGARDAATTFTTEGEVFIRVGAQPKNLKMTVDGNTGTLPGTFAFPKTTFDAIGRNPVKIKDLGDLPGSAPQYFRELRPPFSTPIKRGTVPGGEFGGKGGVPEVLFPEGF